MLPDVLALPRRGTTWREGGREGGREKEEEREREREREGEGGRKRERGREGGDKQHCNASLLSFTATCIWKQWLTACR